MGSQPDRYTIHGHLYILADFERNLVKRLMTQWERKIVGGLPVHLWAAGYYPTKWVCPDRSLPEPPWSYKKPYEIGVERKKTPDPSDLIQFPAL